MKKLPDGWDFIQLNKIADIIRGVSYDGSDSEKEDGEGYASILRAGNIGSSINYDDLVYVPERYVSQEQYLKVGDVLIATSSGSKHIVGKAAQIKNDKKISFGAFCCVIRPKMVDPEYLNSYFQSKHYKSFVQRTLRGANINNLRISQIRELEIPLPPLHLQKKIAAVLGKAEKLREWRNEADGLTDRFLKSTFLEMFGDPVGNPKGWEYKKLMELGNWQSGGTPSRSNGDYFKGDIPWYTAGELNSLFVYGSIEKITQDAIKESSAKLISPNNLLLGMYDTAALKSSITTVECACNQAIVFSKLEYGLANIFYLFYVIHVARKHYMRQQRGVRQKNLNLSMIRNLEVPVPSIELQNKFAYIVQQVEQIREHQTQSRQHIENFFYALMQKAFSGELEAK